jgi:hypothetical protein
MGGEETSELVVASHISSLPIEGCLRMLPEFNIICFDRSYQLLLKFKYFPFLTIKIQRNPWKMVGGRKYMKILFFIFLGEEELEAFETAAKPQYFAKTVIVMIIPANFSGMGWDGWMVLIEGSGAV